LIGRLAFDGLNATVMVVTAAEILEEDVNDTAVRLLWNMFTTPRGKSMIGRVACVIDAETAL
jgi:hypothetical protein